MAIKNSVSTYTIFDLFMFVYSINVFDCCLSGVLCYILYLGLLRVSEYSDIHGSNKKFEYEYSSLPKSVDRDLFFFFFLTTETSGFSVKLARQMSCKVNLKSNNNESLTMANL